MAQWYPRMCVYDDLRGWDTLPYIGAEFYLEYGHFDYFVTVPWDFLVAGSGELVNPTEVLTKTELARLEEARHSDKTVYIRKPEETTESSEQAEAGGNADLALSYGSHAGCGVLRFADVCLGCGAE